MGSNRKQKTGIKIFTVIFLLLPFFLMNSCNKKDNTSALHLIDAWAKKKYSLEAKTILSGPLEVEFPDIQAYRGSIQWEKKQIEGIFFINKKDHSVEFFNANAIKTEENQ